MEAVNRAGKPREASTGSGREGINVIALRSELAREIAAHIQAETRQKSVF